MLNAIESPRKGGPHGSGLGFVSGAVAGKDNKTTLNSMASLDEESTLLRGNAAPKYRTNLGQSAFFHLL